MTYATTRKQPRTLTEREQKTLLRITGEHATGFRDHVIISVALGTALRENEILALNCNDVFDSSGRARRTVHLKVFKRPGGQSSGSSRRRRSTDMPQQVSLPDTLRYKLDKFRRWKIAKGEPVGEDAPLFASRKNERMSDRRLRAAFREWQERCGFNKPFHFHALRHTALTNVYRKTRDISMVQRVARHSNINTSTIYAGPSDEDVAHAVRDLDC